MAWRAWNCRTLQMKILTVLSNFLEFFRHLYFLFVQLDFELVCRLETYITILTTERSE